MEPTLETVTPLCSRFAPLSHKSVPVSNAPHANVMFEKNLMERYDRHVCKAQGSGVRVEYSRGTFHEKFTWQLVVAREATEEDLEKNHHLEEAGEELWSTVIEINNCPFCGKKLRNEKSADLGFVHFNLAGWSVERR